MYLIFGIIIGLLLAVIVFLATKRYETTITRTIKQTENLIKENGEIFTPDDDVEDLKDWINKLPSE